MTEKTMGLLSEITSALYEKKAVLLMGNTGTGKTFLARQAAHKLAEKQYDIFPGSGEGAVSLEVVSCHNSVTYEDIVGGISLGTESGKMTFQYKDKILIRTMLRAAADYHAGKGTKYVLILDDMQRNEIPSLLGDAVGALGAEGQVKRLYLNSGTFVEATPNFFVIGTYNPAETGAVPLSGAFLGKFYVREILPDIGYITEDPESENAALYARVKDLVFRHLNIQYRSGTYEQNRYLPGHGYFDGPEPGLKMKYQLVPVLKQYISEGILDREAEEPVRLLETECQKRTVRHGQPDCFGAYRQGVTPERFAAEDSTRSCSSVPIENLAGRIIEQKLLSNDAVKRRILFNTTVCCREMEVEGVTYRAALIADAVQHDKIRRGGKPGERCLYNGGTIRVDGAEYYFTGGSHPKDYVKDACWSNQGEYKLGESFGGNLVIFRMLWQYYQALAEELKGYTDENPADEEKKKLYGFIQNEWDRFLADFKKIRPKPVSKAAAGWKNIEAEYNREANREVRERIGQLTVLWKNPGDTILADDGTEMILEGVDSTMSGNVYQEYIDAMETLKVKQMILQGPPGTSKTYSAKAFLRYMADNCGSEELADMQISDYGQGKYCERLRKGKAAPKIAWDIVQFHPSYGYEDFIRGIKVSTKAGVDTIFYETVNKVLGNMAELAEKHPETRFFLIIDEINRANLATVFGELIYGLEYRTEPVATPYEINRNSQIRLPENLYLIGTMNTADKSIGSIDYAIRRRFLFFELLPDENVIRNFHADLGDGQRKLNEKACRLFGAVERLFGDPYLSPEYRKEDVQTGHTYFLADSEEKLLRRFEYQIIPILKEYYKDGILQFEEGDCPEELKGLMDCISGKISISRQKEEIWEIFRNLTE